MRDLLTINHTPSCLTVVSASDGAFLWQNPASTAYFGAHGNLNTNTSGLTTTQGSAASTFGSKLDFIELLFYNDEAGRVSMLASVQRGSVHRSQVAILHPQLRLMMRLEEGAEVHHDVQITLSKDPVTMEEALVVAQVDLLSR